MLANGLDTTVIAPIRYSPEKPAINQSPMRSLLPLNGQDVTVPVVATNGSETHELVENGRRHPAIDRAGIDDWNLSSKLHRGKSRLPWLDGSMRGDRQPSVPHVPGAYPTRPPVQSDARTEDSPAETPSSLVLLSHDPSVAFTDWRPSVHRERSQVSTRSSWSLRSNTNRPRLAGVTRKDLSAPEILPQAVELPIDSSQCVPAVPLISLARELLYNISATSTSPKPLLTALERRLHGGKSDDLNHKALIQPASVLSSSGLEKQEAYPSSSKANKKNARGLEQELRNSVAQYDNLMQEAVHLAQVAAETNHAGEVPALSEDARTAMRQASKVQKSHEIAVRGPLRVSDPSSHSSYSSDITSSESQVANSNRTPSGELAPIFRGKLAGKLNHTVPPNNTGDMTTVELETRTANVSNHGGSPQLYQQHDSSADTIAIDWAYADPRAAPSPPTPGHGLKKRWNIPFKRTASTAKMKVSESPPRAQVNFVNQATPDAIEIDDHTSDDEEPPVPPRRSSLRPLRDVGSDELMSPGHSPVGPSGLAEFGYGRRPSQNLGQHHNWGRDKYEEKDYISSNSLKGRHHLTLREGQHFSFHHHRRQPIARNWSTRRKRFTALVACFNTALVGIVIGVYAGEVPAIQYALTDTHHYVILGNVVLYLGMAITTLLFWPLPLLHGRRPYILSALALALPLQFPQAVVVMQQRDPNNAGYRTGLLSSRAISGLALGFIHINLIATLLDLFGASLQSTHPHGEFVITDDVRRHGGGMGLWLGFWSWCWIGSIPIGFLIGAGIISTLNVEWGFYVTLILIAFTLLLNVITPETRRSPHRRTMQEVELPNESVSRRLARGEIRMHVQADGPKWWWEEVSAGIYLSFRMVAQAGFALVALYIAWIYAEVVLVIILLGNLLSLEYAWRPEYVGLGVFAVAIGALLAVPLSKANIFSESRVSGARTDSMTFEKQFTWTSHMIRRFAFMIALPVGGAIYTGVSRGNSVSYMLPIFFAGMIGFFSNLAIAECNGLIMETYDVCDLQPGVNSKHRLQSLPPTTKRRRTAYSSYPRVSAGLFVSQSLGFFLAAGTTGIGGAVTRHVGAQKATGITAGILLLLTLLLTMALWRFKSVQVIPNSLFGSAEVGKKPSVGSLDSLRSWRAVIIGNPSGQVRRMSWIELGSLSRWTEIRRLNRLLTRTSTQALNPGWR